MHIATTPFVSGLDSPVALAWRAHDSRVFVAEQTGRIRVVSAGGTLSPTPLLTVGPLSHGNEEGLLGITFSPDGSKLYVDYTDPDDDTHVDEYTMQGDVASASSRRQLLVVQQPYSNHKGGEVITGPDGMLYIGLGDGGSKGDPKRIGQNKSSFLSKILRINPAAA
ncbi:MAG: glucose/sorbosone dehydrogenase-like protein, partial [Actinomycetia bacterium]|nr:glucose/sorbosone dehydrogenase-like protein [Actinomycetes bacterium]